MLSRRHIRLKVMQSLYSYFSIKENQIDFVEKDMLKHFHSVVELKLVVISLLLEVVRYAQNFYNEGKKKYLPKSSDLNPNTKFISNQVVVNILDDKELMHSVSKVSCIWTNNDHDIARKLFSIIVKSDFYNRYLKSKNITIDKEKKFIVDLMNDYILNNELVHHILEEKSIYWIDDLPFITTIIFGDIRDGNSMNPTSAFKDISDKKFALHLFRDTIKNNIKYEDIIVRFAKNWDLERMAKMDQLLLKMAFSEILSMSDLPIKVSMNEYIEIAKYYSTSKSKIFVNGLLDSFAKTYIQEQKINKENKDLF